MRAIWSPIMAVMATAIVAASPLMAVPAVEASLADTEQAYREGQVLRLDMNGDTITVREPDGVNTYQLSPTGRQDILLEHIKPGDRVRFMVYSDWGVAYQFWRE